MTEMNENNQINETNEINEKNEINEINETKEVFMKNRVISLSFLLLLSIGIFAQPRLKVQKPMSRSYYIPPQMVQLQLEWYGQWVIVPSVGRVWVPSVWVDWQPYYYGMWIWTDAYGWVWYSYEPWGYITYHYGRWMWTPEYGWVWKPGYEWSPGWVVWIEGPSYVGWAPMDPWGNPAGKFSRKITSGKLKPYPGKNIRKPAWVVVNRQSFSMGNYQYLNLNGNFKRGKLVVKSPTITPGKGAKHYILKRIMSGKDVFKQRLKQNLRLKKVKQPEKKKIKRSLKSN